MLDLCKAFACIIVAQCHMPSIFPDPVWEMYYVQWFVRFCVPLFFLSSGYFFYRAKDKTKSLKRIAWLFALSNLLYLPLILSGATGLSEMFSKLRWDLVFGYEHLWYLSATVEGLILWYLLEKIPVLNRIFRKVRVPLCLCLLLIGALLDEYYLVSSNTLIFSAGKFLSNYGGPRNVVFLGFPLLIFGGLMAEYEQSLRKIPAWLLVAVWMVFRGLNFLECRWLFEHLGLGISNDVTFFGWIPALALFELSFRIKVPLPDSIAKLLRRMAEYVYVLHPLVTMFIRAHLDLPTGALWAATVLGCAGLYILLEKNFVLKR